MVKASSPISVELRMTNHEPIAFGQVSIEAEDLTPGEITDVDVVISNDQVQKLNVEYVIEFTLAHEFSDDGKLEISMPEHLALKSTCSVVLVSGFLDPSTPCSVEGNTYVLLTGFDSSDGSQRMTFTIS